MPNPFVHLFALRGNERPMSHEEKSAEHLADAAIAESAVEFAGSRYHSRLITQLETMMAKAFADMKSGQDVAAGRAAGIQEIKEFIRQDIERARKVLNG